jgi:enoyl-CoA hydratase/carnithine racemase
MVLDFVSPFGPVCRRATEERRRVMSELVHVGVADEVATLTLDSQHNRNALSRRLVTEVFEGLDRAEEDATVKIVVLRAEGRAFCSGADLEEASSEGMEEGAGRVMELQRRLLASPKPVVSRVHGAVRAGGIGIVAATDIAICSASATFALTEVRLGLAAATISLTVLPRMTSRAAGRTFLTGETFDGSAASDMGLVSAAVPDEELDASLERVLDDLRKAHPQGLREAKRLVNADLLRRIHEEGEAMVELSSRLFASEGARKAMHAFLTRKPS